MYTIVNVHNGMAYDVGYFHSVAQATQVIYSYGLQNVALPKYVYVDDRDIGFPDMLHYDAFYDNFLELF